MKAPFISRFRLAHRLAGVLCVTLFLQGIAATTGQQKSVAVPSSAAKPSAAVTNTPTASQGKPRPIPFHGTLGAVNASARTIAVGKRTFVITAETKVCKGEGKLPATLKDGVVGAGVTGSYIKSPDGTLVARSIYFKTPEAGSLAAGQKTK